MAGIAEPYSLANLTKGNGMEPKFKVYFMADVKGRVGDSEMGYRYVVIELDNRKVVLDGKEAKGLADAINATCEYVKTVGYKNT